MRGKIKQGRRQEEKKGAIRDGWRWEKRKESEWKGEKGDESNFGMWNPGFSRRRGKHNPLLLSVSKIIISLLIHLQQKRMYLFGTTLRVKCPPDIIQGRLYLVCFCPIISIWISLCCYCTNKVKRSQIDLQEIIVVIVCERNPGNGSFKSAIRCTAAPNRWRSWKPLIRNNASIRHSYWIKYTT